MAAVMLSLGGFKFNIDAAAYNQLVRTWKWNWNAQGRIGQSDLLQCTGKAANKISLNGEIAPTFRSVGTQQVQKLADMGDAFKPWLLVSGLGDVMGYWVITDLTESNSKFIKHGLPRSQSFTVELAYYGEDLQNP